jgi:hypothetical protein
VVIMYCTSGMRSTCINTCITAARNLKGGGTYGGTKVGYSRWFRLSNENTGNMTGTYSGVCHTGTVPPYSAIPVLTVPYGVWEYAEYVR